MPNHREDSRRDWNSNQTLPEIDSGSLQRIADACEAMAKNHIDLQNKYDSMVRQRDYKQTRINNLENSIRSYRGTITKLKKKLGK